MSLMDYGQVCSRLDEGVERFLGEAVALSDWMAANPELSGEEFEATDRIVALLSREGFSVERPYGGLPTAFKASRGDEDGPKVAIMVECDALPSLGHGCGHCVHGSMSVLAGLALSEIVESLGGAVHVVGTPAEETDGAKCSMSEAGLFDGYDLALMIHSSGGMNTTAFRSLAMDGYRFTFTGKASHAAGAPWEGKNALNGVQLMFHAVDMLRQHTIPEARIHGVVDDGGKAPNIVPDRAVCRFEFRAPERGYLDGLTSRCMDCARGAALATGTEVSWETFESSFDDMIPNPPGEAMIGEIYDELGVSFDPPAAPTGSTDVGNVSRRCPTLQPLLAITPERYALHTVDFADSVTKPEAHQALALGARVIGRAVVKTLLDRDLASAMKGIVPGRCV
ncbi:amidohydrolase [Dethiosulfovibrio peptidovorans DSM 11002]|uniref:Peptidase M20 domain-containing protein 2 n=2 Tax=Dethiosulfovibrio TaxID=47054 RepID=D2Z6E3_9BACT|nr:amidohydrolase [Dethiosulfovibrio peptidovorans DSM 11002]